MGEKRLPKYLAEVIGHIEPWQAELAGVMLQSNLCWLVNGLKDLGFSVHLTHTTEIKRFAGLKHRDDENYAHFLAHLLRLGILPTGTTLPPEH